MYVHFARFYCGVGIFFAVVFLNSCDLDHSFRTFSTDATRRERRRILSFFYFLFYPYTHIIPFCILPIASTASTTFSFMSTIFRRALVFSRRVSIEFRFIFSQFSRFSKKILTNFGSTPKKFSFRDLSIPKIINVTLSRMFIQISFIYVRSGRCTYSYMIHKFQHWNLIIPTGKSIEPNELTFVPCIK